MKIRRDTSNKKLASMAFAIAPMTPWAAAWTLLWLWILHLSKSGKSSTCQESAISASRALTRAPINVSREQSIAALPLRASTEMEKSVVLWVPGSAASSCMVGKIQSGESTNSGNSAAASPLTRREVRMLHTSKPFCSPSCCGLAPVSDYDYAGRWF